MKRETFYRKKFTSPLCSTLLILAIFFVSEDAQAQKFEPIPLDAEAYGESYTAIADFSDGSYALVQYVFSNAGFGDAKGACRALVVRPGTKGINSAIRVDKDEWSYQAQGNVLKVSDCSLSSSGNTTRFMAKTEDATIELSLQKKPRAIKAPGHRVKVNKEEFYESEIVIPWAKASANITASGKKSSHKGMGYMDHSRSNTRLPKVASRWLRFRGFSGEKKCLVEIRYSPSGKARGWLWEEDSKRPTKLELSDLERSEKGDTLSFSFGGNQVKTSALIYRYQPAKEWGLLGRLAKPWVGDPETRTYRATMTRADGTTTSGILEQSKITD